MMFDDLLWTEHDLVTRRDPLYSRELMTVRGVCGIRLRKVVPVRHLEQELEQLPPLLVTERVHEEHPADLCRDAELLTKLAHKALMQSLAVIEMSAGQHRKARVVRVSHGQQLAFMEHHTPTTYREVIV